MGKHGIPDSYEVWSVMPLNEWVTPSQIIPKLPASYRAGFIATKMNYMSKSSSEYRLKRRTLDNGTIEYMREFDQKKEDEQVAKIRSNLKLLEERWARNKASTEGGH